jgi:hypothetical protein
MLGKPFVCTALIGQTGCGLRSLQSLKSLDRTLSVAERPNADGCFFAPAARFTVQRSARSGSALVDGMTRIEMRRADNDARLTKTKSAESHMRKRRSGAGRGE